MGCQLTAKTELEDRGVDWLEARFAKVQKEFQQAKK